jgi:hypothetical protein
MVLRNMGAKPKRVFRDAFAGTTGLVAQYKPFILAETKKYPMTDDEYSDEEIAALVAELAKLDRENEFRESDALEQDLAREVP